MKNCPKCNGEGCDRCKGSGMSFGTLPTCRICGKKDGACTYDGEGYSHAKCLTAAVSEPAKDSTTAEPAEKSPDQL